MCVEKVEKFFQVLQVSDRLRMHRRYGIQEGISSGAYAFHSFPEMYIGTIFTACKRSLEQGNFFTIVGHSFCLRGRGSASGGSAPRGVCIGGKGVGQTHYTIWSTSGRYCHRASWGSAVRCKTRDRIERITRTAVLDDLLLGAFIAQFSCNSCHIWHHM